MSLFLSEAARQLDEARERLETYIGGLTEESAQLRERIASLEAERDQLLDEVGRWRRGLLMVGGRDEPHVETARNAQRLTRLRTVARIARSYFPELPADLRSALAQLEEGDV